MLPQTLSAHTLPQILLVECVGRLGEEDLSPVSGAHDAGSSMHIQAGIAFGCKGWFASAQAHAHTHRSDFGQAMAGERTLRVYRCRDSISGASKGHQGS